MKATLAGVIVVTALSPLARGEDPAPVPGDAVGQRVVKNLEMYHEAGRFAGWPANHGARSLGNEILVGFEVGHFRKTRVGHAIDYEKPAEHVLARSLDGGETWTLERPPGLRPPPGVKVGRIPTGPGGQPVTDCPGGIDFTHPGFALTARDLFTVGRKPLPDGRRRLLLRGHRGS
jgi:hypothetical protein